MKKLAQNFEEILCSFFLVIMVVVVILNVLLRFGLNYSLFWAEEVATICFIWLTFIGASAVYKKRMDIGIDILIKKSPKWIQNKVEIFVLFILFLINSYIFYMSIIFSKMAMSKPTPVLGVSSLVMNGALVIGFGLMSFHTLLFIKEKIVNEGKIS